MFQVGLYAIKNMSSVSLQKFKTVTARANFAEEEH